MSDSALDTGAPTLVASPAAAPESSWVEVLAHLVGALGIGAASGFLVLWTSPGFLLGGPVEGFDIIDIAPEAVALAALGLALVARLRPYAWLIAAAGMLGFAGLYAQGNRLDGQTLVIALIVVIALQFGGLLLAFGQAGRHGWTVAVGLGGGIVAGRDALGWLVGAVRRGPLAGTAHGDDVVFAGLGLLVAVAGVVLLLRRGPVPPSVSFPTLPLAAVAVAGVLAVALNEAWDAAFRRLTVTYLGEISDAARSLQTWDHVARVGLAVLVAVVLAVAAHRWSVPGAGRWVGTGLGAALLLAILQGLLAYRATVLVVLLAVAGAVAGALLAHRGPAFPWEAVGLALGACLALVPPTGWLWPVGWFGFGFAVAAGLTVLAQPASGGRGSGAAGLDGGAAGPASATGLDGAAGPASATGLDGAAGPASATGLAEAAGLDGADSGARLAVGRVAAAGLGLAALLLGYQVVVPAGLTRVHTGGDLPVVATGVALAAVVVVAFFALDRRGGAVGLQDPPQRSGLRVFSEN